MVKLDEGSGHAVTWSVDSATSTRNLRAVGRASRIVRCGCEIRAWAWHLIARGGGVRFGYSGGVVLETMTAVTKNCAALTGGSYP